MCGDPSDGGWPHAQQSATIPPSSRLRWEGGAAMTKLRVVVADDHTLMREAVRTVVDGEDDMTVVGEADSGAALLALLERVEADVAVLDLAMPPLDGIECLVRIRAAHPGMKTIVLSGADD